mmetsp:Transcript_15916/g.32284  ORF Transcript_15916/g.32284 Transcript_15916/m.32284 type:complete len:290 (+) Transcript_15916:2488-3357(+)
MNTEGPDPFSSFLKMPLGEKVYTPGRLLKIPPGGRKGEESLEDLKRPPGMKGMDSLPRNRPPGIKGMVPESFLKSPPGIKGVELLDLNRPPGMKGVESLDPLKRPPPGMKGVLSLDLNNPPGGMKTVDPSSCLKIPPPGMNTSDAFDLNKPPPGINRNTPPPGRKGDQEDSFLKMPPPGMKGAEPLPRKMPPPGRKGQKGQGSSDAVDWTAEDSEEAGETVPEEEEKTTSRAPAGAEGWKEKAMNSAGKEAVGSKTMSFVWSDSTARPMKGLSLQESERQTWSVPSICL